MHLLPTLLFLTPLLPHLSAQKTIDVAVGHHGLEYVPSTIVADVGDVIQFTFYNVHSVVQSVPQFPCTPLEGGIYSGIISSCLGCGAAAQRFLHVVGDREAVWFYCALRGHCRGGMVGVINPPLNRTLADYITLAQNVDPDAGSDLLSPTADAPVGGVFVNVTSSSSSSVGGDGMSAVQQGGGGGQAPIGGVLTATSGVSTAGDWSVVFGSVASAARSMGSMAMGTTTSAMSTGSMATTTFLPGTTTSALSTGSMATTMSRSSNSGSRKTGMTCQMCGDTLGKGVFLFLGSVVAFLVCVVL